MLLTTFIHVFRRTASVER